jgi:hypothetical protein
VVAPGEPGSSAIALRRTLHTLACGGSDLYFDLLRFAEVRHKFGTASRPYVVLVSWTEDIASDGPQFYLRMNQIQETTPLHMKIIL